PSSRSRRKRAPSRSYAARAMERRTSVEHCNRDRSGNRPRSHAHSSSKWARIEARPARLKSQSAVGLESASPRSLRGLKSPELASMPSTQSAPRHARLLVPRRALQSRALIVSLHVATGAAGGALVGSRLASLPLGLVLHLAGDLMPHEDIPNRAFVISSGI